MPKKQITKALPDMIEKASDPQLKQGFQTHLRETEGHVKRLDRRFHTLHQTAHVSRSTETRARVSIAVAARVPERAS